MPPWWGPRGRRGDISPEASAGPRLRVPARGRPRELAAGPAVPEGGSDSFSKPALRRRTSRPGFARLHPLEQPTLNAPVFELVARPTRVTQGKGAQSPTTHLWFGS